MNFFHSLGGYAVYARDQVLFVGVPEGSDMKINLPCKAYFETLFESCFADVRVNVDQSPAKLGASAFAYGNTITINNESFSSRSEGPRLG
jgi:hypothetical protein